MALNQIGAGRVVAGGITDSIVTCDNSSAVANGQGVMVVLSAFSAGAISPLGL